jgi:hypothetical protein
MTRFGDFSCKTGGCTPTAGVIADGAGNLYGTTEDGGSDRGGLVYRIEQ